MPNYTGDVGPLGPLFSVGFWVSAGYASRSYGGQPASYTALIDTGASMSAVSPRAQARLRAMVLSSMPLARPGAAPVFVDTVDVRLKLGGHGGRRPWFELEAFASGRGVLLVSGSCWKAADQVEWCGRGLGTALVLATPFYLWAALIID